MEDQFGGRTDDDLFNDDFEPVEGGPTVVAVSDSIHAEPDPEVVARQLLGQTQPSPAPTPPVAAAVQPPKPAPRGGLAFSRFAEKPLDKPQTEIQSESQSQPKSHSPPQPEQPQSLPPPKPQTKSKSKPKQKQKQSPPKQPSPQPSANKASTGPKARKESPRGADSANNGPGQNTAANSDSRSRSGANPRQKMTDAELTEKLEKMKLLSAEKARKFEKAEKDQKQHEEAYARGMEEARKQKAEAAERRRQNEEQRRKLEEERNKNRERKLKAMSMKEGGWDEGKAANAAEDSRRPFRASNGGAKGSKNTGLAVSRFAKNGVEETYEDRVLDDQSRRGGRGRGRRGNGRGRGGIGGGRGAPGGSQRGKSPGKQNVPSKDDFPSLPVSEKKKTPVASPKPVVETPLPLPPLSNLKWDDEMEEFDELNKKAAS